MTAYINSSETNPKSFVVPSNALTNGAGGNNALNMINPPSFDAYDVSGSNSSKLGSASLLFSTSSNFGTFSLSGGLDTFGALIMTFQF